jgi:hypothetical protein
MGSRVVADLVQYLDLGKTSDSGGHQRQRCAALGFAPSLTLSARVDRRGLEIACVRAHVRFNEPAICTTHMATPLAASLGGALFHG